MMAGGHATYIDREGRTHCWGCGHDPHPADLCAVRNIPLTHEPRCGCNYPSAPAP